MTSTNTTQYPDSSITFEDFGIAGDAVYDSVSGTWSDGTAANISGFGEVQNHATPCPSCGHCPTCGRHGYSYPYYAPNPYWQYPTYLPVMIWNGSETSWHHAAPGILYN